MWWLLCCRSDPSRQTIGSSGFRRPSWTLLGSAENDLYQPAGDSLDMERDFSLQDVLQSALRRRQWSHSGMDHGLSATPSAGSAASQNTSSIFQHIRSKPSMGGLLLSSCCAQQFQAFKTLWVQAAMTNRLPLTEAGLNMHEMYLLQYLQARGSTATCSPRIRGASNSPTSSCSKSPNFAQHNSAVAAATARAPSSNASSESPSVKSWHDWSIFAEPPDCPVACSLQWAAATAASSSAARSSHGSTAVRDG